MAKEFRIYSEKELDAQIREARALNRSFQPWHVRYRGLLFLAALAVGAAGWYGHEHRRGIEVRAKQGVEWIVEKMRDEEPKEEEKAQVPEPTPPEKLLVTKSEPEKIPAMPKPATPDERAVEGGRIDAPLPIQVATPPKPLKARNKIPLDEAVSVGKCYLLDKGGDDVYKRFDAVFVFDKQFEKFEQGKRYFIAGRTVSGNRTAVSGQLGEISCEKPATALLDAIVAAKEAQPKRVRLNKVEDNGTCYLLGTQYAIEFDDPPRGFYIGGRYKISSYSPFIVEPKEIQGWKNRKKKEIDCGDLTTSLPLKDYHGYGRCVTLTLADGTRAAGFVFGETLREYGFFRGVKYRVAAQGRNRAEYITHTPVANNTPAERAWECGYVTRKELPNITEDAENLGRVHLVQPMRGE